MPKNIKFNWKIGWSDKSGGSIFTVKDWLPWEREKGILMLIRKGI